jgi:Calcineurin-like phosphoesterase
MSFDAALERARRAAATPPERSLPRTSPGASRTRRLAVGDPQASLERFLDVLDGHGALDPGGRLAADVHLVSIGDHFDWGSAAERSRAAQDGLAILAWLSAHPPDQVTLILGNHDLARVGELLAFDDPGFARAQAEADHLYWGADGTRKGLDSRAEAAFRERYPSLAGVEAAARDFSTFRRPQRTLVAALLRSRRFCAAVAASPSLLVCHAGVTRDELTALGLRPEQQADARLVAQALNSALDSACAAWDGISAFSIPILHRPGGAHSGEARGIFFNRPSNPEHERTTGSASAADYSGPPRRRYDPRRLPVGLTQAIGHIRDDKCRRLFGSWAAGPPAGPGPLRHLTIEGDAVCYAAGVPGHQGTGALALVFIDGAMQDAEPGSYELLDLDRLAPAERPS